VTNRDAIGADEGEIGPELADRLDRRVADGGLGGRPDAAGEQARNCCTGFARNPG